MTAPFASTSPPSLEQQPTLGERRHRLPNHEVIDHLHIDQTKSGLQLTRDNHIRLRRLGMARRMVVRENYSGGVVLQCRLHDLARMHGGAGGRTSEQLEVLDQAIVSIQQDHREDLVLSRAELRSKERLDDFRSLQHLRAFSEAAG